MTNARTFENKICEWFKRKGCWAHRLAPNEGGAQPFDVIALKGGTVWAIDCKLCSRPYFPFSRIELNQRLSFDLLSKICPSAYIGIIAAHNGTIYWISWKKIKELESDGMKGVNLNECYCWGDYNN